MARTVAVNRAELRSCANDAVIGMEVLVAKVSTASFNRNKRLADWVIDNCVMDALPSGNSVGDGQLSGSIAARLKCPVTHSGQLGMLSESVATFDPLDLPNLNRKPSPILP